MIWLLWFIAVAVAWSIVVLGWREWSKWFIDAPFATIGAACWMLACLPWHVCSLLREWATLRKRGLR